MIIAPLFRDSDHLPLLITPSLNPTLEHLRSYLTSRKTDLHKLLLQHGAILFRGFEINSPEDFKACVESLGAQPFGYAGGNSPRRQVAVDVFTSTEYPASETISLHNEMSYLARWPNRLFFFSQLPAESGGQTSLALSRYVLRALPEEVVARFRERKLTYLRTFHPRIPLGKTWQATYSTQERADVETAIKNQGSSFAWLPDGGLRVSTRCEALIRHPKTGEEVWFNQAEQWHPSALSHDLRRVLEKMGVKDALPHDCRYGDGEMIGEEFLTRIRQTLDSCKLRFDWKRGDVLMVDNVLVMHGRETFRGPRKTLVYVSST